MQLNWKIPAIALMVLFVGCSKENNNMSGELVIEDLVVGEGAEVKQYDIVNVNYTGKLTNGNVFDSSLNPGRSPFRFTVGAGQVIKGWDEGVTGMRAGGKRMMLVPPSLGYGKTGVPPIIPPNSTLFLEVELL